MDDSQTETPFSAVRSAEDALPALAAAAWRLARVTIRAIERLPADEQKRVANQCRFLWRQIEGELASAGVRVNALEGQLFDAGCPANPVNAEDFAPEEQVRVAQTLEPAVLGPGDRIRFGSVILERV